MNAYETLFIINPNITEEDSKVVIERIKSVIEKSGSVKEVAEWGKKKLAYEINKVREGYFVLITFEAGNDVLDELNHIYRITENILRGIVTRLEK